MKIFLLGFMGSGKTYWGKIWANEMNLDFYDLDDLIEKKEARSVGSIFNGSGEKYFREIESETLKATSRIDNCIIACGGGTPCFNDNLDWMKANGATVYLQSSPGQLTHRLLSEKSKRPLIKNIDDNDLFLFIEQKLHERETFYLRSSYVIPVEKATAATLVELFNSTHE